MALEIAHVVADTADAELPEIRQVFPDLGGVEMKLLGQRLRRDRADARAFEHVQAPEVDGQTVGGELRHLIGALLAGRRSR